MSGVFPSSGVPASQTTGADGTIAAANLANCPDGALFYSTARCEPRFDPAAANALLSEVVNLVRCAALQYDCAKYTNLCDAVNALIAASQTDLPATGVTPGQYGNATTVGQFTVGADGRIVQAANVPIAFPGGGVGTVLPSPFDPRPIGAYIIHSSNVPHTPGSTTTNGGPVTPPGGLPGGATGPAFPGTWVCTSDINDENAAVNYYSLWCRTA